MPDAHDPAPWRDARLTPESVASRTFGTAKRGYVESEVRAYLRMIADDLASAAGRERELQARLREVESRGTPSVLPASDEALIAALGEETARVLTQARESARELRAKAEEHARRVVRDAQETARELRATTQQVVETRTREAEDSARARAKEIVAEARTLRDRVLNDLTERRTELERHITELRSGRGRLVETYQLVERALAHAARTLADDSGAAPGPSARSEPGADAGTQPTAAVEVPASVPESPATAAGVPESATGADGGATTDTETGGSDDDEPGPNVEALFERLRAGADSEPSPGADDATAEPSAGEGAGAADATAGEAVDAEGHSGEALPGEGPSDEEAPDEEPPDETTRDETTADEGPIAVRDRALAPLEAELATRAKRALQDEQNDVLDRLRRQRGRVDLSSILPEESEQRTRWAHVLQPVVDRAYAAGASTVGAARDAAPGPLLSDLAAVAVAPFRERLDAALGGIDARNPADAELAVAQRLGARYREWRGQDLERVLGDALAVAYARGVYDAAPAGSLLRWVPAREGKCPDCDDNGLEPTARGKSFPTGQLHPPAHPGCRCTLVVEPPS